MDYRFKQFTVSFIGDFTGDQFTRDDNSDGIPAYVVVDLNTGYVFDLKWGAAKLFFKINNLLNADYMQMQWYPMPPVNFEGGVRLSIK
jgi:vitamin B12 transporter